MLQFRSAGSIEWQSARNHRSGRLVKPPNCLVVLSQEQRNSDHFQPLLTRVLSHWETSPRDRFMTLSATVNFIRYRLTIFQKPTTIWQHRHYQQGGWPLKVGLVNVPVYHRTIQATQQRYQWQLVQHLQQPQQKRRPQQHQLQLLPQVQQQP